MAVLAAAVMEQSVQMAQTPLVETEGLEHLHLFQGHRFSMRVVEAVELLQVGQEALAGLALVVMAVMPTRQRLVLRERLTEAAVEVEVVRQIHHQAQTKAEVEVALA